MKAGPRDWSAVVVKNQEKSRRLEEGKITERGARTARGERVRVMRMARRRARRQRRRDLMAAFIVRKAIETAVDTGEGGEIMAVGLVGVGGCSQRAGFDSIRVDRVVPKRRVAARWVAARWREDTGRRWRRFALVALEKKEEEKRKGVEEDREV